MVKASDIVRAAPKFMGTPYSRMDCQAFVEACLKEAGNSTNLGGSNAWYRECMKNGWVGTPEECKKKNGKIPPGAFLFIHSHDGGEEKRGYHDGLGNAEHIGLYTGETGKQMVKQATDAGIANAKQYNFGNGAMHSSSKRECVCTSAFAGKTIRGGWNMVGLWNKVEYNDGDEEKPEENAMQVTYTAEVTGGGLNMRREKSTNAQKITQIPNGARVLVTEEDGDWSKVTYAGLEGYVLNSFLKEIKPEDETIVVKKKELMDVYDKIGSMLGMRG